ncbi:uncharacterized protein LOC110251536 [Exaiptasia diaphana]|uniref:Uncharacterized protein n=1 Tax=Exaiptasia diaphana TaxID=2652724 RepID=A0A913Y3K3_EXADI|nr:uncharacterized protein LOC110251536 [Exaiptasia diaphana]
MGVKAIITTIAVVMAILEIQSKPSVQFNRRNTNQPGKRASVKHVCDSAPRDQVIQKDNRYVKCLKPSNQELKKEINAIGGLNRHYFANSLDEARKDFSNMFKVYGDLLNNTEQWRSWVNNKFISSPYVSTPTTTTTKTTTSTNTLSVKRDEMENANKEVKVDKRDSGNIAIQCLPGGRDTENGVHLCPACQRCTELPANYYPRFVNELTCDDSFSGNQNETRCALGTGPVGIPIPIGTCHQVSMSFDVLVHQPGQYNITFQNETYIEYKEIFTEAPWEVRTFCECMAKSIFKIE